MGLTRWLRAISYTGFDRRGRLKVLQARPPSPEAVDVPNVSPDIRDEALGLLCDAFDIPAQQMHCLRPADELMGLYQAMIGPRWWDDLEFERLAISLDEVTGPDLSDEAFRGLRTVGDVIRFVAERRGPK